MVVIKLHLDAILVNLDAMLVAIIKRFLRKIGIVPKLELNFRENIA